MKIISKKTEELKKIKNELLSFKVSPLYEYRTENNYFPVIGEGSHDAQIVFIGEAPGKNEAKTGRPFCGASGRILDELLESVGVNRGDVYITNVVKDRPPGNRDPKPEEIQMYAPFLDRQIEIIQPKVVATLGRFSMKYILERYGEEEFTQPIGQVHGQSFPVKMGYGQALVVPLYHPAVAVYNGNMKADLKKDFQIIKKLGGRTNNG